MRPTKEILEETNELNYITIYNAREHNLKNINLQIPRNKFIVITGISGSGKSSLAFDTIYAEGQRRYVQALSIYARQYLGLLKKPEIDKIEGLSPAISIDQKTISTNPRSTVGTVTEIYDYLRLLFAKIGIQYCDECNVPVVQKSIDQIVEEILKEFSGKRVLILAPLVKARKGHYRELFESLIKQGFTKVRVDGEVQDLEPEMQLNRYQIHNIELVTDRMIISEEHEHRLSQSIELAINRSEGFVILMYEVSGKHWDEKLFSTLYSCPKCGKAYPELAPNMFSFNSPYGACPKCDGIGEISFFDPELIIPNKELSIADGAIAPLGKQRETWLWQQIIAFLNQYNIPLNTPIKDIPKNIFNNLLYGSENLTLPIQYSFAKSKSIVYHHNFTGIIPTLQHQYDNTASYTIKKNLENFRNTTICPVCNGSRLKKESTNVLINHYSIFDIAQMDINSAINAVKEIQKHFDRKNRIIANIIVKEIINRLNFILNVGLSYLTLNRTIKSLSGGESQRIRLASQIGSQLTGILYVLDEPSIGLHPYDNNKLINTLKKLRDLSNTIIVVEHDKTMMEEADYIIDLGPGAGINGGRVLFCASPNEIKNLPKEIEQKSLTAQYLNNKKEIPISKERRKGNGNKLILRGASGNNLKNIDLILPLGTFICITGLSGSGKSTLINDTLYPVLSKHFYKSNIKPLPYKSIEGLEYIDKVIEIDQSPIGRTPRSNPATYTGLFTYIRDFFAQLPEAKMRGYKPGRFSFNVKGGRCETCEGAGIRKIEMNFLPDVYVTCETCNGKRYNQETLSIKYKNKSIADVLDLTVAEALEFFKEIPKIKQKLTTMNDVGLSYIKLGQQAPTLSGGEAQRVKLSAELSKTSSGKTLYLLDEPTTGLHFEDIRILISLLQSLVDKGNTVIIIEHNLDVIKCADWVIDLGPEGGENGGEIIAEGTPEEIAMNPKSYTGKFLKPLLIKDKKYGYS